MSDSAGGGNGTNGAGEGRNERKHFSRRRVLQQGGVTSAAIVGLVGLSGSATAAPWKRFTVDFKGCSEVWLIVDSTDLDPDVVDYYPLVAHVIVAHSDGTITCELVEFRKEYTTKIPGQYGDAPVLKFSVEEGQKILGVIKYNDRDPPTSEPSCLYRNEHQCAHTPGTPDVESAPCVQEAIDGHWEGGVWDDCSPVQGGGNNRGRNNNPGRNGHGRGRENEGNGRRRGNSDHAPGRGKGRAPDRRRGR